MMNKISDLNNHLFAQLEKLSDDELTGDKLKEEIERAKAITSISNNIIQTGKLALEAEQFISEYYIADKVRLPEFFNK